jgi:hypothetical protein
VEEADWRFGIFRKIAAYSESKGWTLTISNALRFYDLSSITNERRPLYLQAQG